ncbi:MAG: hypothetical protein M3319_14305, partial [Actinomycetota bacterium]|nr:hypothetical protein [Actinomycetota bacterium]
EPGEVHLRQALAGKIHRTDGDSFRMKGSEHQREGTQTQLINPTSGILTGHQWVTETWPLPSGVVGRRGEQASEKARP